MALLSINERRDLIRPYLAAAKVNWGTIALAQLIVEGFVDRVLTVNFDLVLENACGLLGAQPAVYDFGVAPANDPAMIVSPAIIHLHGQSYGLILLNTDDETQKHRKKLQPVLIDSLRNAPMVVVGYSGSADGISQTLLDEFEGREPLYWIGYSEELATHLQGFGKKDHFHFLGGADFDLFMIELGQALDCWPPRLFTDPFGHLLEELGPVVEYPSGDSEGSIDLLQTLRGRLGSLRSRISEEESRTKALQESFMKRDFEDVAKRYDSWPGSATISKEERVIVYWSFVKWGNLLSEQAEQADGEEAVRLYGLAVEKYEAALAVKSDQHEALYNWGNLLSERAKRAGDEESARLFELAMEKYGATLAIKPDKHEALNNWGNVLFEQAGRAGGEEAARLFKRAEEKYEAALAIKPDKHEALYNWGSVFFERAKRAGGEEAARLFGLAEEKYRAALAIKPDKREALNNWGNVLFERAKRADGEEAARLFGLAEEKYCAAFAIKPEDHEVLNNWGVVLSEQAERAGGEEAARLFGLAGAKYGAALAIKPDLHEALNNWGSVLLEQAKRAHGEEAVRLFGLAEEKLVAAAKLDGSHTYNLACLTALRSDEVQCRRYLENAEQKDTLPDLDHLVADSDLDSIRDTQWFKALLDRQK